MRDTYCSFCGAKHTAQNYPKLCTNCDEMTWGSVEGAVNLLVPVDRKDGPQALLLIRRKGGVKHGELSFPGGYIDYKEDWKIAAAREMREETGIVVDHEEIDLVTVLSSKSNNVVLIFGETQPILESDLKGFLPNDEVSELVLGCEGQKLAFNRSQEVYDNHFHEMKLFGMLG